MPLHAVLDEAKSIVEFLYQKLGEDLIAVALFGSCARGDFHAGSDIDLLVIAQNLPANRVDRLMFLNDIIISCHVRKWPGFVAKTRKEFMSDFPALYLDFGLDAKVLYDSHGFLRQCLERIREITAEAGLYRVSTAHGFSWRWKKRPKRGWEITWEGYRELS